MNIWVTIIFVVYAIAFDRQARRRLFLFMRVLKPLINKNFAVMSSPGLPLLSLDMMICISTIGYYLLFHRENLSLFRSFPLKKAFYLYISSLLLSTVFSTIGFSQGIVKSIAYINDNWLSLFYSGFSLRKRKTSLFYLRAMYLFFPYGCICIFEKVMVYNPVMEFESSLIQDNTKIISFFYSNVDRLGMGRIQSFTVHAITYGGLLAILLVSYFHVYLNYKAWKKSIVVIIVVSHSFFLNIIFTNSRTPLVLFFIAFIGLLDIKNKNLIRLISLLGVAIVIVLVAFNQYLSIYYENIISIWSAGAAERVGGSGFLQRMSQFLVAIELFKAHPIFGLGLGSIQDLFTANVGILGAESVWLPIIIEQGFGVLVVIYSLFMNCIIRFE